MTYLVNNNSLNVTKRVEFRENPPDANGPVIRTNGLALIQSNYDEDERPELPIDAVRSQIVDILRKNSTSIIIGETGSGKSTQIPQMCLEAGLQKHGKIAITQPRRVAAMALAHRVAYELETTVGEQVGYKFRFENITSDKTEITFLTDGILLREIVHQGLLEDYSTIIIDEAHERSLHTDILFYLLRLIQKQRLDNEDVHPLKLVIMSATMEAEKFSMHFDNAPIYYIEGRTYPVELFYANELSIRDEDFVYNAVTTVLDLHEEEPIESDFLVFLTGKEEIEKAQRMIIDEQKKFTPNTPQIIPLVLYAALSPSAQKHVFDKAPPNNRKVILSTNIAETSLTIPGIRIVIDSGKVKQKSFTPQNRIEVLKVMNVSKAQAIQRAGRAGREAPGKCYRLYSQKDYEKFPEMSVPEILRSNLSSVLLEIFTIGLKSTSALKLVDRPKDELIESSVQELQRIGAVELITKVFKKKDVLQTVVNVTELGQKLALFPLDPAFAMILLAAERLRCLEEAITVVAFISSEDVIVPIKRESDSNNSDSEATSRKFDTNEGDHVKFLNIYRAYKTAKNTYTDKELKEWCNGNGLSERRLINVIKTRKQLREICSRSKMRIESCGQYHAHLRHAIADGLFMNACQFNPATQAFKLLSSPGVQVKIHPSSCLARQRPTTIVFTELVKTTDLFARTVSLVDAEWVNEALKSHNSSKSS